ncbi:conserved exported hypothetical protein [Methylocella tundrae]|uniref:Uncharacterized protein n=1 Tax=Methylocella tundrae TaxID=227605 RepID=A0A8B6M7J3_METTU|nr:hypothetical protein [Methylocella tundrae]VTZ50777.1 conserved exported hypothetical protein [Methylocella tundrae]
MQPWKTMVTAVALMASVAASGVAEAAAAPIANLGAIAYGDSVLPLDEAQFVWGGRRYCWYPGGWRGPGWYWCGYAWRRGFGWGGGAGWRGWRAPPRHIHHRPVVRPGGGHAVRPGGRPGGGQMVRPGGGHGGGRPGGGGSGGGRRG